MRNADSLLLQLEELHQTVTAPTCLQNTYSSREKVRCVTEGLVYPACIVCSYLASDPTILSVQLGLRRAAEEISFLGHHVATCLNLTI